MIPRFARSIRERYWADPRHWRVPSPLLVSASALVAAATAATWWCLRQPSQAGLPILLLVLFSESVLWLCLLAAAVRGLAAELKIENARVVARLDALQKLDRLDKLDRLEAAIVEVRGQLDRQRVGSGGSHPSTDAIRGELDPLKRHLEELIARARYEIEDGKMLLFELLDDRGSPAISVGTPRKGSDDAR